MIIKAIKVSSTSNPRAVAGAIAGLINEQKYAEIRVVGAGAVNQAVKAIAIARGFVATSGINLICSPAFVNMQVNNENVTAIEFLVRGERR